MSSWLENSVTPPPSPFILITRIILMMLKKISEVSLISSQFQARVSLLTEWASPCKLAGLLEWQILALLCAASVIIVPSCCFSVGCDLSPGTVPPPLLEPLVQLADSVTVVLMTHCFTWCHPQSTFFFTFLFYFNVFCVCKKPFESSLYFDYRMLSFVKVLKISVQETIILRGFYYRPIMKFLLHFRFIWIKYNIWQNLSHSCMLLNLHQLFIHAGTRRL